MPPKVGDNIIRLGIGKLVRITEIEEYSNFYRCTCEGAEDYVSLDKNKYYEKHYLYDNNLNKYLTTNIQNRPTQYGFYVDENNNYHPVELQGIELNLNPTEQILRNSKWQRIDVQPTPNDVVMCSIVEDKALASYANPITKFRYIEDHGWVDMDRSNIQYNEGTGEWTGTFVSLDIAEGVYYYDMDNDTVFVADENLELQAMPMEN